MIPDGPVRQQIASELSALGGTPEQVERIGSALFQVSALPFGHDAEFLLERMDAEEDPLVARGLQIILDGLVA